MQTSLLFSGDSVQFKSIDKESMWILDKYLCNRIINIPRPVRYKFINKFEYNTQSFIESYKKNFPENSDPAFPIDERDFREVSKLYDSMISFIRELGSKTLSKLNFDTRCELLSGVVPMATEDIKKYMCLPATNFSLFGCTYDLIFNKIELRGVKRGILEHYSEYSNKYKKLTQRELAREEKLTFHAVGSANSFMERRLSEAISYFRLLGPYYSYGSKIRLHKNGLKISQRGYESIRRAEGEEMTDKFIARVASVIYGKKEEIQTRRVKEEDLVPQRKRTKGAITTESASSKFY